MADGYLEKKYYKNPKLFYLHKSDDHIHNLRHDIGRGLFSKTGITAVQIKHSGLITRNRAICFRAAVQPDMEGMPPVRCA